MHLKIIYTLSWISSIFRNNILHNIIGINKLVNNYNCGYIWTRFVILYTMCMRRGQVWPGSSRARLTNQRLPHLLLCLFHRAQPSNHVTKNYNIQWGARTWRKFPNKHARAITNLPITAVEGLLPVRFIYFLSLGHQFLWPLLLGLDKPAGDRERDINSTTKRCTCHYNKSRAPRSRTTTLFYDQRTYSHT